MMYKAVIIDDEAWTRDTIKRLGHWQEYGFRIVGEGADGISGMECIRSLMPDLIITDMNMPGLNGAEMLKVLDAEKIRAKVIVISGYDDYNYIRQAVCSGAMDYLLKPVKEEEFNALLKRCAQELGSQELNKSKGLKDLLGIVDKVWMDEYRRIREDFKVCLEGLSVQGIHAVLKQIRELLIPYREKEGALKLLIKVNYDLQRILEETAILRCTEYEINRIFFSLREMSTFDELLNHYRTEGELVIKNIEEGENGRNRININAIHEYMLVNYAENLTLEGMANQYYISKEYLSFAFKKETGSTFTNELIRIRMEKAKQLITEYHLPIQKAAEMTGYTDIAHFYKTFKKFFGNSPGKIKEESQKQEQNRI